MNPVRRFTREIGPGLWLVGLGFGLLVLLWALGDGVKSVLQYERAAVFQGEWWRLVTGHLVHVDLRHTLLNVAGGIAMTALFYNTFPARDWTIILLASLVACDLGFLIREKDLIDYVGFSGILHGVLVAGTLAWWRTETKPLAFALTVVTFGKLFWEQWQGPVSLAADTMKVIVNAHLYGAIGGGVVGAVLLAMGRVPRRVFKQE